MKISLCTTSMNRLHHLRETLPQNLKDNPSGNGIEVEFVVVDYGSDDGLEQWIKTDPDMVREMNAGRLVYARYDDAKHFRHAHAKNMAHRLATGDIVCNVDADNFTGPGFAQYLAELMSKQKHGVIAHSLQALESESTKSAFGRIATFRRDFMNMGGYNENFSQGWGGEDTNFIIRAFALGFKAAYIEGLKFLNSIAHSDEERVKHTSEASKDKGNALKKVKAASSLSAAFRDASGPAQANNGHFGEGTLYVGLEGRKEVLGQYTPEKIWSRPAFLGQVDWVRHGLQRSLLKALQPLISPKPF